MKKTLLGFVTFAFAIALAMPSALAAENLGTAVEDRPGDSFLEGAKPTITGENSSKIVFDYGQVELKYVEDIDGKNRGIKAAWIGIKVTAPSQDFNAGQAKVRRIARSGDKNIVDGYQVYDWNTVRDGSEYTSVYYSFTEEELEAAAKAGQEYIEKAYEFAWNDGTNYTQTIAVRVHPKQVTLKNEKGAEIFTPTKALELAPKPEPVQTNTTTTKEVKKDDVPKTNDELPIALCGILLVLVMGAGVYKLETAKY